MYFSQNPIWYIRFEEFLVIPKFISFAGNYIKMDLKNFLNEEGLSLPLLKSFPTLGLNKEHFKNEYRGMNGVDYCITIKANGNTVHSINRGVLDDSHYFEHVVPKEVTRIMYTSNSDANPYVTPLLVIAEDVDQLMNSLERRFGISTDLFDIYVFEDLLEYIKGTKPLSKLKPRKVKREFKINILK